MSLEGTYDPNNPFARILRGELPSAKIYEDDDTLAFLDLFPQSPGHALVISKKSAARNLLDVEPGALSAIAATVQRVARALSATLQPDGLHVMQANGSEAGQTVFHLHVHVIPRWSDRPLALHAGAPQADAEQLKTLAARVAAHC